MTYSAIELFRSLPLLTTRAYQPFGKKLKTKVSQLKKNFNNTIKLIIFLSYSITSIDKKGGNAYSVNRIIFKQASQRSYESLNK